jgi:hypothetical protein
MLIYFGQGIYLYSRQLYNSKKGRPEIYSWMFEDYNIPSDPVALHS